VPGNWRRPGKRKGRAERHPEKPGKGRRETSLKSQEKDRTEIEKKRRRV
jgi:hypothetical protein